MRHVYKLSSDSKPLHTFVLINALLSHAVTPYFSCKPVISSNPTSQSKYNGVESFQFWGRSTIAVTALARAKSDKSPTS